MFAERGGGASGRKQRLVGGLHSGGIEASLESGGYAHRFQAVEADSEKMRGERVGALSRFGTASQTSRYRRIPQSVRRTTARSYGLLAEITFFLTRGIRVFGQSLLCLLCMRGAYRGHWKGKR